MTCFYKLNKICVLFSGFFYLLLLSIATAKAEQPEKVYDLYIKSGKVVTHKADDAAVVMVFEDGVQLSAGRYELSGGRGVIRIESEEGNPGEIEYLVYAYVGKKVWGKGERPVDFYRAEAGDGEAVLVRFRVPGVVLLSADERIEKDPGDMELYKKADSAIGAIKVRGNRQIPVRIIMRSFAIR